MSYTSFVKKHVFHWFLALIVSVVVFLVASVIDTDLVYSSVVRESAGEVYSVISSVKNETQGFVKTESGITFVKPSFEHRLSVLFKTLSIIYINNALYNTLFTIPFTGIAIYVNSLVYTSLISKYISMEIRNNWFGNIVESIILSPHTYLELLAYSITVVESTYIGLIYIRSFIKKKWIVEEKTIAYSLFSIGLSYIILLIAGLVESIIVVFLT